MNKVNYNNIISSLVKECDKHPNCITCKYIGVCYLHDLVPSKVIAYLKAVKEWKR